MAMTVAMLFGLIAPIGGKVVAQSSTAEFAGVSVLGGCDETDGAYNHELMLPSFSEGVPIGSEGSNPAAQSLSVVPVLIGELVQDTSSIRVTDRNGDVLACDEIGGILGSDGSLVFGIDEVANSGVSGIAYFSLAPDGLQTNVSLFLTGIEPPDSASAASESTAAQSVAETAPTAVPTDVPDVAATDIDAADLAYVEAVSDNLITMSASVGRNGDLFINHRLDDPVWYEEVAAELAIQDEQYRQFNLLVPPPAFAEIHQLIFESYTLIILAGDDIELGLATFDPSYFEAATVKITQSGVLMEEATELINEMTDEVLGN